jgi:DNA-binding SARP family transcriptional activator/Tfp pilus assembly protein PilF
LLAVLAAAGNRGVSRDVLQTYFWPESSAESARHALEQLLYALRRSFGESLFVGTNPLTLNSRVITSDVADFERALDDDRASEAIALYRGPFLHGFFISDAPEFERWVASERDRLAGPDARALERLATGAEREGDWSLAAQWWRRLATHEPLSSRVAYRTMCALERAGDVTGALQHARIHQTRVREELGLDCDPDVRGLAERLRTRVPARSSSTADEATRGPALVLGLPAAATAPPGMPGPGHWSLTRNRLVAAAAIATLIVGASALSVLSRFNSTPATAAASPSNARAASALPMALSGLRDEAADLCNQGRYYLSKGGFDPNIHERALDLFRQCAARDSTFAPAYAGMAEVYNHADDPSRAKASALRAIALDDSLAEGYTALAYVLAFYEYRWAAADSALDRATALKPRYVLAHLRRANVRLAEGRGAEAQASVDSADPLEPESFVVLLNRAMVAELTGRPHEATKYYETAILMEPGRVDARETLSWSYWRQGRYADAQSTMRNTGNIAGIAAMSGNRDTMTLVADRYARSDKPDSIVKAAMLYVRLGREADAFIQLERAYQRRDKFLALRMRHEPFASLRGNPRYERFLRKLNLN